jgi:hypothetical protein
VSLDVAPESDTDGKGDPMQYDPLVIVGNAEELMRQRLEVKIVRTVNHFAMGFVIGVVSAFILALVPVGSFWQETLTPNLVIVTPMLIFAVIGFLRAVEEAKELRFRAHMLLCQVEIERHLSELVGQRAEA